MDARELSNFFTARGVDRDCPACGFDGQWARIEGDSDLEIPTMHVGTSIPVAAVLCQNCGFVRMHSLDVIRHLLVEPDIGGTD